MRLRLPRPGLSLRSKLALVSLALLALPWAGYRYVKEMERFLLEAQQSSLLGTTRAVATALHERPLLLGVRPDESALRQQAEEERLRRLAAARGVQATLAQLTGPEPHMREVRNASELLITHREEAVSGISIASMLEGIRPMLIETQALVTPSVYGTPQRTSTGFDLRRMNMLLAVLEKRCGFHFGVKDVFLNIAGGLRVEDPAIDLAVVAALLSFL